MAAKMTFQKGLELLNNGHSLTATGRNLDTLTKRKDGRYNWVGLNDQGPTVLDESDIMRLFRDRFWEVDLF